MNAKLYNHNFKSPIFQIKNNAKAKDGLWLLFNYGNLFYKSIEEQYYRNIELVKVRELNYKIRNWYLTQKLIVAIPEIWSLLYPIGTIFNDQGLPVLYPKGKIRGELHEYDIILSNNYNYKEDSYIEILENTKFPIPSSYSLSDNPFFLYESKKIQYIIPIDVIKRAFYYHSYKGIETTIYRKIDKGICNLHHIKDLSVVEYDSTYLVKSDVQSIAKYLFTKEYSSSQSSGLDRLKLEVDKFYTRSLQGLDGNDIHFKLPFLQPIKIKVLGQFITDFDTIGIKKFIVYRILEYASYRESECLFTTKNILAFDRNDKTSTINRDQKEEKKTKSLIGVQEKHSSIEVDCANPTNSSLKSLDIGIIHGISCKQDINVEFIHRDDQKYKYVTDKVFTQLSGIGTNSLGRSNSTLERLNYTESDTSLLEEQTNEVFEVFLLALKNLQERGVETRIITINSSQENYSFLKSRNNSITLKMLIARLTYLGREYCVIDANKGYSIGIFSNEGNSLQMKDDHNLSIFLQNMLNDCKFQWSSCFYSNKGVQGLNVAEKKERFFKILSSHRFQILSPMDHLSKPLIDNYKCLSDRILRRIKESI